MGIFSDKKPYTAISSETEALLHQGPKLDPAKLLNLIELIQVSTPSDAGGRECGRVLRKKIKYGSANEHIHAIGLIETIVDNGVRTGPFIIDSGLSDQLTQLAASHASRADLTKEGKAARRCRTMLHNWSTRKDRNISTLFSKAGLVDKDECSANRRSVHVDNDLDEDFAGQLRSGHTRSSSKFYAHSRSASSSSNSPPVRPARPLNGNTSHSRQISRSPSPLNIREASIGTIVATAHNIATKLTTSLITNPHGGHDTDSYYRQAKQLRKRIIQLIHDNSHDVQSYIGQLLSANEELIASLQAYDAVINIGESLEEQSDHDELDPHIVNSIKHSRNIQPVRPPPSPPIHSASDESDLEDTDHAAVRNRGTRPRPVESPFDPFGDDNEQEERPKHTPLW